MRASAPPRAAAQAGLIKKDDTGWAWRVARADAAAVTRCDAIFAVVNGVPPDEGVHERMSCVHATRPATQVLPPTHLKSRSTFGSISRGGNKEPGEGIRNRACFHPRGSGLP